MNHPCLIYLHLISLAPQQVGRQQVAAHRRVCLARPGLAVCDAARRPALEDVPVAGGNGQTSGNGGVGKAAKGRGEAVKTAAEGQGKAAKRQ